MLALYEWGRDYGSEAYLHVGLAVRSAQALELHEDTLERSWDTLDAARRSLKPLYNVKPDEEELLDPDTAEAFIAEETRRRTFWSCVVLDQYLSSGGRRPAMIRTESVALQLPCSEKAWVFGTRTTTQRLDGKLSTACMHELLTIQRRLYRLWCEEARDGTRDGRPLEGEANTASKDEADSAIMSELEQDEPLQSRLVRIAELWGQVVQWSCLSGSRFVLPPLLL